MKTDLNSYSGMIEFINATTPGTLLKSYSGIISGIARMQSRLHELLMTEDQENLSDADQFSQIDPEDLFFLQAMNEQLINMMRK